MKFKHPYAQLFIGLVGLLFGLTGAAALQYSEETGTRFLIIGLIFLVPLLIFNILSSPEKVIKQPDKQPEDDKDA